MGKRGWESKAFQEAKGSKEVHLLLCGLLRTGAVSCSALAQGGKGPSYSQQQRGETRGIG